MTGVFHGYSSTLCFLHLIYFVNHSVLVIVPSNLNNCILVHFSSCKGDITYLASPLLKELLSVSNVLINNIIHVCVEVYIQDIYKKHIYIRVKYT